MKRLILLVVVILLCGCSPQRRLARLIERFPLDTITTIEYRDTTIWRDTTITRYLPGESTTNNVYIDVPVNLPDTFIMAETSLARALAHLSDNMLGLELIQFDSLFQWKLDSALRHDIDTMIIINDIPYPEYIPAKPLFKYGFFIFGGLILVGMILLLAFRKR